VIWGAHVLESVQIRVKENRMTCESKVAKFGGCLLLVVLLAGIAGSAAKQKYSVHDKTRPHPPDVTPASQFGQPPSDAIILFNGKDLSQWRSDRGNGEAK